VFLRKLARLLVRPAAQNPTESTPARAARPSSAERPPILDKFVRRESEVPAHVSASVARRSLSLVDDDSPGYDPYNTAPVPPMPPDAVAMRSGNR